MPVALRLRAFTMLIVGLSFSASAAWGQWVVGLEVGADRFWGGTVERAPEHRSFRPYRPTTFGLSIERRPRRLGVALHLRYSQASLGLEGKDAVVAVKGVFKVVSAAPEFVYQISSLGPGNELVVQVGPDFQVWDLADQDGRIRIGAQGVLSLVIPLGGRFGAALSGSAALMASPFNEEDLDTGFSPRTLWRRRFAVALQYRL
jgi:hypothetical protein